MVDKEKNFTDANKLKGKNIIILFFPDCDHCQREATEIAERMKSFDGYTLYFLSINPFDEILKFSEKYKLNGIQNVRFVQTTGDAIYSNFGSVPTPGVVLAKMACDMFGFTILIGAPGNALSHLWKDLGWDLKAFRAAFRPGWYRRIVVPNLLPNWVVWGPGTAIFYSLPVELQLPVANAIGTCWALMCVRIAAHSRERT